MNEDFKGPEDLDGFFSGWDPESKTYDPNSWSYEGGSVASPAGQREHATQAFSEHQGGGMMEGEPKRDETLEHPRTVFRQLMRHYARYTPEMVERVCGISAGGLPQGRQHADRELGPRADHRLLLRARLDAAHQRRADDPRRRDPAAAARQHGPPGRRDHGDARPRVDPGLDRHPHALRPAAGLPADAQGARGRVRARGLRRLQRQRARLVVELRQVHRLAAEGLLRRRGDRGERLRLRAAAEDHGQPLALPDDAARLRRRPRRAARDGPEPGRRLAALRPAAARARAPEVARGARPLRARDRDVLARRARGPLRRDAPGGHPDRGLPDAGRLARREGRALHQHAAAAAVARQGDRAARRRALGAVVHAPPVQARARALRGLDRPTATGRS